MSCNNKDVFGIISFIPKIIAPENVLHANEKEHTANIILPYHQ